MTPDEIRSFGLEHRDPEITVTGNVQDCASMLREAAAQLAELNESRKPRWVNLGTHTPLLVDATQVVGLGLGQVVGGSGYLPAVLIYLRSTAKPLTITDRDHDEVRGLLGIDEDWIERTAPMRHDHLPIHRDEWNAAHELLQAAKRYLEPGMQNSTTDYFAALKTAVEKFDDFSMPF
jgi:hypothetical protein